MTRALEYHEEVMEDIYQLNGYIEEKCKAPLTARRYLEGMEKSILWLQENADIFRLSQSCLCRWAILSAG